LYLRLESPGGFVGRRCREVAVWGLAVAQISMAAALPAPYFPAVYEGVSQDSGQLIVFPFSSSKFYVPVPGLHGGIVYGSDGKAVYVTSAERREIPGAVGRFGTMSVPGLFKVDLENGRVAAVPGSTEFLYILSFAVSQRQDKVIVSGHRCHIRVVKL